MSKALTDNNKAYYEAQQVKYNTLESIEHESWQDMQRGAVNSKDDYHQPVIATLHNGLPSVRTVVLRKALPNFKQLIFHTDVRSAKIKDLEANPNISWLFYSQRHRVQLRLGGVATILHSGTLVNEAKANIVAQLNTCYMVHPAPGISSEQATTGLPTELTLRKPTTAEITLSMHNFVMVHTQVQYMEWLWLHHKGHRRAAFYYNDDSLYKATWLVP